MSFIQVFRIPDEMPQDFSFGGAVGVNFLREDFFEAPEIPDDYSKYLVWKASLSNFISRKPYHSPLRKFLVLCGNGTFVMNS